MIRRLLIAVTLLTVATTVSAQSTIPTPDEFVGYKLGQRFTPYDRILDYFQELTKRSPLITMQQFGETYEHRPLVLAVITSAKNRAALNQIRQRVVSLSDPDTTSEAAAADIARSTPAIAWLAFGVHGNETSSAEAAMRVAYTLVTNGEPAAMLDNLVIVIDPLQNPDGRERYIHWFERTRGVEANSNPDAFEHNEGWPSGRFNHYLIDMNRDWAWTSQLETRARVSEYTKWNPQVFVDFHEMGYQSTYFFPPDAKPINANLPKDVEKWLEVFGKANAAVFSEKGWPFFVAESFDLFYPAYGDSWPALHGAVGMTYEVAGNGRAGTSISRDDDSVLTLADRIERHYTTGMTTLRTASAHREELLRYSYDAMRAEMAGGKATFLVPPTSPNFQPFIEMLQRQSIRIGMTTTPMEVRASRVDTGAVETKTFPPGTAVINTHQPLGGLAQTLLEKTPAFSKGFLEEQRQKAQADEADTFYDLTSWSLPLAMNIEAFVAAAPLTKDPVPFSAAPLALFHPAAYGYLVDALNPNVYRLAGAMLKKGIKFSVSEDAVSAGDHQFGRGSIIILKGSNRPDLDAVLEVLGRENDVTPFPLDSGWMGGTAFGSERIHFIRDPKIALVGGAGTGSTSYGMLWHTFDIDTPIPHTELALDSLRNTNLDHYHVIILPDGDNYADRLGKRGIEKLQGWIRNGGTLVAIKEASNFLREKEVEISKLKSWAPPKKKDDDPATVEERYNDFRIPGSTFRTTMNERSYLTFGLARSPFVLIEGSAAWLPLAHKVDNIVTIETHDPLVSGVAWPESLDRLKGAAYMTSEPYGKGSVVTFADEPHYRLFWRGTLPLLMNTVLYSPSFPRD